MSQYYEGHFGEEIDQNWDKGTNLDKVVGKDLHDHQEKTSRQFH